MLLTDEKRTFSAFYSRVFGLAREHSKGGDQFVVTRSLVKAQLFKVIGLNADRYVVDTTFD